MHTARVARLSALALTLTLAGSAFAQSIVPTSQVRSIAGQSSGVTPGGPVDSGLQMTDNSFGDFSTWNATLPIPGIVSGQGRQNGGFNGTDTIELTDFFIQLSGGGGPGMSGTATIRNEFTYTFEVPAASQFTLNSHASCQGPEGAAPLTTIDWSLSLSLVGPGGDVVRFETGAENEYAIVANNVTGSLAMGTYTLSFVGEGLTSFETTETAGNGAGGGGGGGQPIMTFNVVAVTTPTCPADLGVAGGQPGNDGMLDNNDFIAFINYFFNQDVHADKGVAGGLPGQDGQFDNNDFIAFITQFFNGC